MPANKYIVLEKIGKGGMAEVYRAKITGAAGFEKVIAIKRLLPHLIGREESVQMLVDEAKILSTLSHPNIVQIYDFEKIGEEYFIIMEYVSGRALSWVLFELEKNRKTLPVGLIVTIATETATGLNYAHHKTDENDRPLGIVHRDISPQNILISAEGLVKVTDFGIAQAAIRTSQTQDGMVKGKLGYLSPEQVREQKPDARSDLFSLGIVIHQMLTGSELFMRETEIQTVTAVLQWPGLDISVLPADTPEGLAHILEKMLRPNPQQRYQDSQELLADLKNLELETNLDTGTHALASFLREVLGSNISVNPEIQTAHQPLEELISSQIERITRLLSFEDLPATQEVLAPSQPASVTVPIIPARRPWWRSWPGWLFLGLCLMSGLALILWKSFDQKREFFPQSENILAQDEPSAQDEPPDGSVQALLETDGSQAPVSSQEASKRERKPSGTLILNSEPWAYVEINGKRLKQPTPVIDLNLPAGKYNIRLYNPVVKRSKNIQVRILPNKTTRRAIRF